MGLDINKLAELDEKLIRVITSCKTVNQLRVAHKYARLVEKQLRQDIDKPSDICYLAERMATRKGFIMGLIWTMQGREYMDYERFN